MKEIIFYRTINDKCPVEEFLDNLTDKQARKVTWVLRLIREIDNPPSEYWKKLVNTDDLWEVRVQVGNNSFRILGFFNKDKFIILTNGFAKKTQKTPKKEIELAQSRKKDYLERTK